MGLLELVRATLALFVELVDGDGYGCLLLLLVGFFHLNVHIRVNSLIVLMRFQGAAWLRSSILGQLLSDYMLS